MITKPTVFVLGAGASMPYGFPSGSRLVREICGSTGIHFEDNHSGLLNKGDITKILHDVFGELKTEEFGKALHLSQRYSIDAFLERRPEYMDIGKWAIALFILRQEISENLFSFESQDKGCYRFLFDKLDTSWDLLENNNVSFITFNYDRSLEHFLFTAFQKTYGKSENECTEAVARLPIVHVHGSLGKLPWQDKDGVSYGADIEKYNEKTSIANGAASRASKQIKIIPENQSSSEEFQSAFRLLSKAECIYFLGFGYNPTSLDRLQVSSLPKLLESGIYQHQLSPMKGTAKDLQDGDVKFVQDRWHIQLPDTSSDSLMFLRKYADLS